jgi:hypothetical protein
MDGVSVGGFGGADEEPLGGAGDTSPGVAASRDAQGVVAFMGKRGGFLAFIGEVALGGGYGLRSWANSNESPKRRSLPDSLEGTRVLVARRK